MGAALQYAVCVPTSSVMENRPSSLSRPTMPRSKTRGRKLRGHELRAISPAVKCENAHQVGFGNRGQNGSTRGRASPSLTLDGTPRCRPGNRDSKHFAVPLPRTTHAAFSRLRAWCPNGRAGSSPVSRTVSMQGFANSIADPFSFGRRGSQGESGKKCGGCVGDVWQHWKRDPDLVERVAASCSGSAARGTHPHPAPLCECPLQVWLRRPRHQQVHSWLDWPHRPAKRRGRRLSSSTETQEADASYRTTHLTA